MRYQVLGPLRVTSEDTVLRIGAPKMESVLTALLARANQVVSKAALLTEIWGEDPPRRAVPAVHVYISQLRKLLATPERTESPIVTRPPGYVLLAGPEDLDCTVFQRLVQQGRTQMERGRTEEAARSFEQALGLWRGPARNELRGGPIVDGYMTWLEECRLECVQDHIEVSLLLGRHRSVVSWLSGLVTEYPLHEAFYGQLMRALHASDRRADALQVYRRAWDVLDREFGLEPSPTLRNLQQSLLAADLRRPMRPAI
ncbi:MAG TPA: AfsR/SARP family transcriptional regulator [Mycobacteriales bacterium]|nr:AfsR/SARP family transcriptional regulator [Mycobacteriales bacterium]